VKEDHMSDVEWPEPADDPETEPAEAWARDQDEPDDDEAS
jgi:hypothetical protein